MHELSIALGIIDVATEEAESRQAVLRAVHIKIGALSGVVARALVSAWDLAREGTPAAEAELVIEETPAVVRCEACGTESVIESILSMQCAVRRADGQRHLGARVGGRGLGIGVECGGVVHSAIGRCAIGRCAIGRGGFVAGGVLTGES